MRRVQNSTVRVFGGSILSLALLSLGASEALWAQQIVSVKAGLINYYWGEVYLNSGRLPRMSQQFPKLDPGEILRTGRGRAELVLNAGRMFRLDSDSELEILSDDLESIELRLLRGSAYLEWDWSAAGDAIRVRVGESTTQVRGHGLFRWEAREGSAAVIKVYDGKALVETAGRNETVKSERSQELASLAGEAQKFDAEPRDRFDRWNARRSREIARINRPADHRSGSSRGDHGTMSAEHPGIPRLSGGR